ncbi:Splicing factor, arginine/serine-rich 2 [Camponotus floridanus]|uniref:Serine/arginine-rich splicing factor 2 n=1 Tax=Camponotus floridanus TaxID=104421 RepID=E2AXG3_CAMFO|nr:Splicing factor, arginine/serine-rich 2 [Camponotus floridanus]
MSYGRPPPRIDGMVSLKVDNLTYRTTPEDLRRVFERCGEVGDIYIPRDRFTRESRGFAFVRFYDKRDAEDALDAMDGRLLDGRELRVQMARYGRPTSPHRSRGSRRRGRIKFPIRSQSLAGTFVATLYIHAHHAVEVGIVGVLDLDPAVDRVAVIEIVGALIPAVVVALVLIAKARAESHAHAASPRTGKRIAVPNLGTELVKEYARG